MTTHASDGSSKQTFGTPRTLWQWILVYPTLAISLFGSIPTVLQGYHSVSWQLPFDSVPGAKRQNELWETNLECTRTAKTQTVTDKLNTQVSVTMCPSGDVLVRVQQPDSRQILKWIDVKEFLGSSSRGIAGLLLSEALAADDRIVVAQANSVLCQRLLANGRLMRRVKDDKGTCFMEVINTYTGVLESRVPAPCSDRCE